MSWLLIRQKREHCEQLTKDSRDILNLAETEKRSPTDEEKGRFKEIYEEVDGLKSEVDMLEKQLELDSFVAADDRSGTQPGREDTTGDEEDEARGSEPDKKAEHKALVAFLRGGRDFLTAGQKSALAPNIRGFGEITEKNQKQILGEMRALGVGSDTAGGFLTIPHEFLGQIQNASLAFGGMRRAGSTIIPTSDGNDIPIPTSDDTSNTGEQLGENVAAGEQDVTVGQVILKSFMYSSKLVKVPIQLLTDSAFPVDTWLAGRLGERLGRITNTKFTTGTGTGPEGIIEGATTAFTSAASASVTYNEILRLIHSVDSSYRSMPSVGFQFNDQTLLALRQLQDGEGQYLWSNGTQFREPDLLAGFRFTVNQDLADMATTTKSILFGAMEKYYIRDVGSPMMLRLVERYAENLQQAFLMFQRHDGRLVDAGTAPVKFITQV